MQREVYKTVQLRLLKGRDFPLELLSCPLLLELYVGRYPRLSLERGNWRWRCSRCGGPFEGTHMVVHTCRELNRPRWSKAAMQQHGMLNDDTSRCQLCRTLVGAARPHVCASPLAASFTADLSALYEPWGGLGQEQYTLVRRQQGQVVVVMPEAAHRSQPARALETGELIIFQGLVAQSRVVAAGQELQAAAAALSDTNSSNDELAQGRSLGLYSLLDMQAVEATAASMPRQPGYPRLQQTWVCLYSGQLHEDNQTDEDPMTMRVWNWRCTKSAAVEPAREGGVAVLINCGHGERANAATELVWRPDLQFRVPYIRAVRDAPAGTEVLYDYRAVTKDKAEHDDPCLNPACGCGCGGRLLAYHS